MLRLTNLADYALVLICEVGRAEDRVNAQSLAAGTGIPVPTVSKILNALGKAGLLISHRGLKGGFTLSRPAADISMAEVIEAIDGPLALTHCSESTADDCSYEQFCGMRPHWQHINSVVRGALDDVKLSKIITTETDSEALFPPVSANRG